MPVVGASPSFIALKLCWSRYSTVCWVFSFWIGSARHEWPDFSLQAVSAAPPLCPVLMFSCAMSDLKALSSVMTILSPGHSLPFVDLVECKVSACFPLPPFPFRSFSAPLPRSACHSGHWRTSPVRVDCVTTASWNSSAGGGAVPGCCPSWIDVALVAAAFICPWPARPPHDHALTLRDAMIRGTGRACP